MIPEVLLRRQRKTIDLGIISYSHIYINPYSRKYLSGSNMSRSGNIVLTLHTTKNINLSSGIYTIMVDGTVYSGIVHSKKSMGAGLYKYVFYLLDGATPLYESEEIRKERSSDNN